MKKLSIQSAAAWVVLVVLLPWSASARVAPGSRTLPQGAGTVTQDSGPACACNFSSVAGVGDLDRDGRADYAVADEKSSTVAIFHGPRPAEGASIPLGSADATFSVPTTARLEIRVAAGGDVNGDGWRDVLIGTPGDNAGGASAGAVYVLYGPIFGHLSPSSLNVAKIVGVAGSSAGSAIASGGDINGDGKSDILIGAPGLGGTGGVHVVRGPVIGVRTLPGVAVLTMTGPSLGSEAGLSVAGGVNLVAGAEPDIVVGAPFADPGQRRDAGEVFVIAGANTGTFPLEGGGFQFDGVSPQEFAGYDVAIGELTGDAHADVVIGAPGPFHQGANGKVYVVPGGPSMEPGPLPAGGRTLAGETGASSGARLAVGDVSGDGKDDLAVDGASYNHGAGVVDVLYGPVASSQTATPLSSANARLVGPGSEFLGTVAAVGDIDRSCGGDLVIGGTTKTYVVHQTECGAVSSLLHPIIDSTCLLNATVCTQLHSANRNIVWGRLGL